MSSAEFRVALLFRLLEKMKVAKYREPYRRKGFYFKPIAAEMHGLTSKLFQQWLFQKLVTRATEKSHIPHSVLFSYWQKRMSTTLQSQKNNAKVLHLAERKIVREFGTYAGIIEDRLVNDCILNDNNHNYNLHY